MNTPYIDDQDLEQGEPYNYSSQRHRSSFKLQERSDEAEIKQRSSSLRIFADEADNLNVPRIKLSAKASFDSQNFPGTASHIDLWISTKLQELGLEVSSKMIKRTIRAYPDETSRDFILEAILQKYYEGDSSEEEESDNVSERKIHLGDNADGPAPTTTRRPDTPRYRIIKMFDDEEGPSSERLFDDDNDMYNDLTPKWLKRGGSAPDSSNLNITFYCNTCYSKKPGDPKDFKTFTCVHPVCRDCLYEKYEEIRNNNQEISTLECSATSTCKAKIIVTKFYDILPEAEEPDLGDEEIGTCDICFDTIKGSKEALQIFKCNEHFYCYLCTKLHIKEHIDNLKVLKLQCPHEGCGGAIDDDKMKKIIPKYMFEKYFRFKNNMLVERNPNLKWCTRPGCEQIVEKGSKPKVVCKCGQETCFDCGNVWHKGQTCEKALEKQYKLFAKQKDVHFCPECKSRIEKAEGCNHMTCLICTYEWCWLCKGEYSRNHYDPFNPLGCPGLMSGHNTRQNWGKLKIYGYRFLIFLGLLVAIVTFPAWIIVVAILFPNLLYTPRYDRHGCTVCVLRTILFVVGFCLFPLTLVLGAIAAIVPGSCYLGAYIYKFFKEKLEAKRRRRRLIKDRLGRERNAARPELDDPFPLIQPLLLD